MIETVRSALVERGLKRGCRFMITANLFDDMRVHLLFNGLGCDSQRVFDRQRRACSVRDDADAIYPEKGTAAVFFIIHLILNRSNCTPREVCADFSHPFAQELL